MYKLMIVDDEDFSRSSLKEAIKWEEMSIEFIGEAEDGIEAVAMFEDLKPHIVLMDINIPFKNGLDAAQEMLKMDKDVQIIIITGYPDLDNATKSIKLGMIDFVTKPVDEHELHKAIKRTCVILDNLRKEKLRSERLEKLMNESIPILKEKFLNELLQEDRETSKECIEGRLNYLNIDILNEVYGISIVMPEMHTNIAAKESDNIFVSVKNIIEELFSENKIKNIIYLDNMNRFIIIFSCIGRSVFKNIDNVFIKIRDKVKFYFNIDLYAGIGCEVPSLAVIRQSYSSACHALNYVNIYGRSNVVNSININKLEKNKTVYSGKDIDLLVTCFNTGNKEEYEEKLNSLVNRVITDSYGNIKCLKRMLLELLASILRVCSDMSIDIDNYLMDKEPYTILLSFNNVLSLKEWVINTCNELMDMIVSRRKEKANRVIEIAKCYIQDNYMNNQLNLKMVSEYVGLSNIYFCNLFYQETNMHFNEFLNRIRIENAKESLRKSILKIYEIAFNVGYSDPKHFIFTFKKFTGKTPNDYRKSV